MSAPLVDRVPPGPAPANAPVPPARAPTPGPVTSTTPGRGWIGRSGVAAGWLVDPTGRHEQRYWSGSAWTEHVSDGGVPGTDQPPDLGAT
jgi:hypothetical protein